MSILIIFCVTFFSTFLSCVSFLPRLWDGFAKLCFDSICSYFLQFHILIAFVCMRVMHYMYSTLYIFIFWPAELVCVILDVWQSFAKVNGSNWALNEITKHKYSKVFFLNNIFYSANYKMLKFTSADYWALFRQYHIIVDRALIFFFFSPFNITLYVLVFYLFDRICRYTHSIYISLK